MNACELLNFFRSHSIELDIVDDKIKLKAPRGFMTDELLESLKKNKNEIIALLKTNDSNGRLIPRRPKDISPPLSFAQQRLWFLDQFEPGSAYYNIPGAIHLTGELNVTALQQTVNEIVRRHETLRTSFAMLEDMPVQVIAARLDVPLRIIDLTDIPTAEREARARELIQKEAETPFDLSTGPLIRVSLLHLDANDHILFFTLHHIVSDGWSMGVLVKEVVALYTAFVKGNPSPLPALPIQYADFAHWQRQWLSGEVLQEQLDYWTQQLQDSPTLLTLPTDHPRPLVESHCGATHTFEISEQIMTRLHKLNNQTQTTLFMSLLAAFNILLSRYSGQDDICVGAPIANRNWTEIENLIGFFVNTLVLRTRIDCTASFATLLDQVRTTTLDAYAHQDIPFEQLVDVLKPERHTSHTPLFQVMLVLQNAPMGNLELPGLTLRPVATENTTAKFDLTLNVMEANGRLLAAIEYNSDLFEPETIQRMAGHFTHLLEAIIAHPDAPIRDLQMLDAAELHQLLVEWNNTRVEYPREKCIHELFEAQVECTPDTIAVVFEAQQLTYRELNTRANQLAHYLREQGVGPDVCVGICMERSLEMMIGLLAILKAGGAYLPLDPDYPKERLRFILEDNSIQWVLIQPASREEFEQIAVVSSSVKMIGLSTDQEQIAACPTNNLTTHIDPQNLAYIIYTSGSTGVPKGVGITHRNVLRLILPGNIYARFSADEVFLQFAPLAFDASTFEIWGCLLNGASLVIFPGHLPTPTELTRFVQANKITILWLTAGLFHQMVDSAPAGLETVHQLLAGGDVLSVSHLIKAQQQWPACRLINGYGPTESTTFTCCYNIENGFGASVPIGRPIANTQVYILDARLQPVPIGVTGELYIGGDGLARGYLNRPDLTAEKFIPNPFSNEPGARMYRTGDLARYLPDGNIEFLGRIDHQVKIRGFRIELGEIEAALSLHPAVQNCVVIAREDQPGDKRLVAYLVMQEGRDLPEVSELRSKLSQSLPEYMLPAHFVFLESLPLNPNGKIDRKALPAPNMIRSEIGYVAPRTPLEENLAQIWAGVIHLDKVGIHDNFFELGGHSLLATQVVSRIRQTLDAEVHLRMLFQTPTVAGLAEQIQALQGTTTLPLVPVTRSGQLPLSFAQQRLWFLDQFEPGSAYYNIPGAIRLLGGLNETALQETVNEIVRRHEALRTSFAMLDGAPVQVITRQLDVPLYISDLTDLPTAEREARAQELAQAEAQNLFDLSSGPLIRVSLLRLDTHDHILLFTLHHIVADGWSMGIIVNEVAALYPAFLKGEPSPLPELPIQYADFAHWQRQWLSGEILQEQLDYWTRQLDGCPTLLTLPTDHLRPTMQSHRGVTHIFEISEQITTGLRKLNNQTQTTLFMSLVAAFNILLSRYSGQEDICIGTPIANRNRAEIEDLIGFFVNTLVLRTKIDGTMSFEGLLQHVRTATLDAYANQDVPFEQLVEVLKVERHTDHSPLFQVMLALQNAPRDNLELPGLTLQAVISENTTAKFDLTLNLIEVNGRLLASLVYNADLFEPATIQRMAGHFTHLLTAIVADPSAQIQSLNMMSATELHQLLVEWNDTQVEYPQEKCIHELFETQVERTPEAVAVVFEDRQLTYTELNTRANQLAHYLRDLGVGPEVLVGICMERSLEMIVGLLAILKAGGAYVPLDPSYPKERLAFMLEDARVSVLLTQTRLGAKLPALAMQIVCLDVVGESLFPKNKMNVMSGVCPDNPAYVIYTSGSTGKAKGVTVTHSSMVNYICWVDKSLFKGKAYKIPALTKPTFDASLKQLFTPLLHGNAVWLISEEVVAQPSTLLHLLDIQAAEVVNCVPSLWHAILNAIQLEKITQWGKHLELLLIGGESLDANLISQTYEILPHIQLRNLYGPTEATANVSAAKITADKAITIGQPIANVLLYILDTNLNPTPIGTTGEIYIGGAGLARGYLNRPDLTAEKFIPNPFSNEPGARMYRTGDLARYLPDGNIEFLGRIDHQVKIRGFRIELGEIEAALTALPEVREAIVLAREDISGDKRLVAYLVMQEGLALPEVAELQGRLARCLPEYMLPAHFIQLEQLPLTPNGKVDRKALPAPSMTRSEVGYVAPRTPIEELLAQIWADVLHLDRVSIHDNFFELGGHSLSAVRLMARIQKTFQSQIPLSSLFQSPTLEQFAVLVTKRTAPPWSPIVPIRPHGSKTPLFCIHEVTGFASFYTDLARHLDPDRPFYGLQARGLDKQQIPHTSIHEMATCYREAIQQVQAQGPYLLAGHSMGGVIAYEVSQQLKQRGEEIAFLGLLDAHVHIIDAPEPASEKLLIGYLCQADQPIEQLDQMISETDEDMVPKAFAIAQQAELVPADLRLADFQRYFEVYKTNVHAASTYRPRPYSGTATLFVCQEPTAQNAAVKQANIDRWSNLVPNLELYEVPGNHKSMVLPPHVDYLATEISNCLRRVMPET